MDESAAVAGFFGGSVLMNAAAAVRGAEAGCGWVGHSRFQAAIESKALLQMSLMC